MKDGLLLGEGITRIRCSAFESAKGSRTGTAFGDGQRRQSAPSAGVKTAARGRVDREGGGKVARREAGERFPPRCACGRDGCGEASPRVGRARTLPQPDSTLCVARGRDGKLTGLTALALSSEKRRLFPNAACFLSAPATRSSPYSRTDTA